MSPLLPLYRVATTLAAPGLRLMLHRRIARGKEIAARLPERRGIDTTPRPDGRLIWLHAASVGETLSILPVIESLLADPALHVLVTTGTVTSADQLARRLPHARLLHRFIPLDVPRWIARFLDHWRPDAGAMVESEIWPNLLTICRERRIPLLLINARLSQRSFDRWRRLPGLARTLLGSFTAIQAQAEADALRLRALGASHVTAPGNLKFAAEPLPADPVELARLCHLLGDRPVWLAAQTHPGEEDIVIAAHNALANRHPGLLTVIAPRHPDRGATLAERAGAPQRSLGQDPPAGGIWIADTMGDLGLLYRAIQLVFVGRSLTVSGGQNPLEPARLGCSVLVGPRTGNFSDIVATLQQAGALEVLPDAPALDRAIDRLLSNPDARDRMGQAGIATARAATDLPRLVAHSLAALCQ